MVAHPVVAWSVGVVMSFLVGLHLVAVCFRVVTKALKEIWHGK